MTWVGGQKTGTDWAVYSGTSFALGGSINTDGWRLRIISGYGRYSYDGKRTSGQQPASITFRGHNPFADTLIGYRWSHGDWTFKAFAGLATTNHIIEPFDPDNTAIGNKFGGTAALEAWLPLTDRLWLSLDGSYATTFNTHSITVRSGYRLWPAFSGGLEAGVTGNNDYSGGRIAAFGAFDASLFRLNDSYFRLSAGASGDRDMDLKPYAAFSMSLRY